MLLVETLNANDEALRQSLAWLSPRDIHPCRIWVAIEGARLLVPDRHSVTGIKSGPGGHRE
jgi:hypothetical protein